MRSTARSIRLTTCAMSRCPSQLTTVRAAVTAVSRAMANRQGGDRQFLDGLAWSFSNCAMISARIVATSLRKRATSAPQFGKTLPHLAPVLDERIAKPLGLLDGAGDHASPGCLGTLARAPAGLPASITRKI
jgi:hypothetical protein